MTEIIKTNITEEDSYTNIEFVMKLDGEEIGWASVMDDGKAYVERIDIAEDHRNCGYGTEFINYLSREFGSVFLAPDNEDAQRLYDRLGYDVTGKDEWSYVDQGYGVYEI